ncbi:MAG: type IX secretion system sortase PorU [Bacteroidota bacterium]
MNRALFFLIAFFLFQTPFNSNAQSSKSEIIILNWSDSTKQVELSDYKKHKTLYFSGAQYDLAHAGAVPIYAKSIKLPLNTLPEIKIVNAVYEFANADDFISIPESIEESYYSIGFEKGKPIADIFIPALRINKTNGRIEKLKTFQIEYSYVPENANKYSAVKKRGNASNSVLATGVWFKIGVTKDGIYKIDKSFFSSVGINTNQINPKNLKIYFAGAGMLPESNSASRVDDLKEMAIKVVGEEDGKFDDGDFILFYGQSPNRWTLNTLTNKFTHSQNIYSDYTYYFLTVGVSNGKRIQTIGSETSTPNQTFSYFDDYEYHEADTANVLASGRDWLGESFKYILSQNFNFSFPNHLVETSADMNAAVASHTVTGQGSRDFLFTLNGNSLGNINVPETCSDYTCPVAVGATQSFSFIPNSDQININITYSSNADDANGWLNYLELNVKRNLILSGDQMPFRVIASAAAGNISQFNLTSSSSVTVWDVTDPWAVKEITLNVNGDSKSFVAKTDLLNEYISFNGNSFFTSSNSGKIKNQNLHATPATDYIIVVPEAFKSSADELAEFHRQNDNLKVRVVTIEQVNNEFGKGAGDLCAIRDFMKMLYDRADGDTSLMPKYLLLFGDGSFDFKNRVDNNTNFIPTYESYQSFDPTSSFNTDDFFGFLDDNEGGNMLSSGMKMDIAVGRLPVKDATEAEDVVSKIKFYKSPSSLGPWQNVLTFCADDEDGNTHINAMNSIADNVGLNYPQFNIDKIYLDAYQQISTPGGARYPDVNTAINNRIYSGTLIFNYMGHGGPTGLAHERILSNVDFDGWTNRCKLPLFITATCDFSNFDDALIVSAGERLMLNPNGGAIGLVTTTRLVYSSGNEDLNQNFMSQVFQVVNGKPISVGEALRIAKNNIGGQVDNNRKFTLLGDPAISLVNSSNKILTSTINTHPVTSGSDTLKALEKVTVTGIITDKNGVKISTYNGTVFPAVFDKSVTYRTLHNDPDSPYKDFKLQKNAIFNGKASVKNGDFSFTFIVPKDIAYQFGNGKLSYYADDGTSSASGYKNDIVVGGSASVFDQDNKGPQIQIYMNDEKFVFGGMTDENPTLYVKLKDESGINTVGNGIGHDVTGMKDEDTKSTFVLNDFYESNLDDYQSGTIRYPLKNLTEGRHNISVKAWDVYNNSNESYTEFIVASSAQAALAHVLNYPNPFTSQTEFMFEHNLSTGVLQVKIEIYSVSGKLVKTILQSVDEGSSDAVSCMGETNSGSFRVNGIMWDGNDDFGDPLAKGVYVYRVSIKNDAGLKADTFEKLVLLK